MGFFNCCSLVGQEGIGASVLGIAGVDGALGGSGFSGGLTGGGGGASCCIFNLLVSY